MKRPWLLAALLAVCLVVCGLGSLPVLFKHYRMRQDGMFPTIKAGAIVVTRRRPYRQLADVRRGDVVVWEDRRHGEVHIVIWRVMGLPGDHLSFRGPELFLDDQPLRRKPLGTHDGLQMYSESLDGVSYRVAYDIEARRTDVESMVPPGHLFVVGDNRDHAYDSRSHGPVPFSSVVGRAVWWPDAQSR